MKFTAEVESQVLGVGTDVTKEVKLSESKDVNLAMVRWMSDVIKLTVEGIEKVDAKATLNLRQSVDFRTYRWRRRLHRWRWRWRPTGS